MISFRDKVTHLLKSGFQVLYISTSERCRCEAALADIAKNMDMGCVTWDGVNGYSMVKQADPMKYNDPLEALLTLDNKQESNKTVWGKLKNVMVVMRNLHGFLEDASVRQAFQNLYYSRALLTDDTHRPIIILANADQIHPEIAECVTVVDFDLPDEKELGNVFNDVTSMVVIDESRNNEKDALKAVATYDEEMREACVQAMRGLTSREAENILSYGLRANRGFNPTLVDTIEDQKAKTIEKSEILTYVPRERIASMDDIGGYEELKDFMSERKLAYTKAARDIGMDLPRGLVLLGVAGVGKSMVAKVISRELNLPLVVMNVSAIFGSLVGESERRVRTALATIDALDGAVVLIDEAEKALGGASENAGDSGTSRRVFGVILTWLTEKRSRTFVVLTMNKTTGIPPEFLRKGRFDEIFYASIPTAEERDAILRIHARKRNVDITQYKQEDWQKLIDATDKFVGAELEQLICDARFMSFASRQTGQPTINELLTVTSKVIPLAESEKKTIEEIEAMCKGRARPVSRAAANNKPVKQRSARALAC